MKKRLIATLLTLSPLPLLAASKIAIFGMGCFWCGQADFDKLPGVVKTTVGYDGGRKPNPTYQQVSSGSTRYVETVRVTYDPDKVSYPQLLNYFWHHIDPTVKNAQFCDHGEQYRSVIFYVNTQQKQQALASLNSIKKLFPKVYTQVLPTTKFYPAETYHQNYYKKNPYRYKFYRWRCGRDARIKEVWHGKAAL